MHRVFETFIERLSESVDEVDLYNAITSVVMAFELPSFAYLCLSHGPRGDPHLVSNYPCAWTSNYLTERYQKIDPVVIRAKRGWETFRWGPERFRMSKRQQQFFHEAAEFGIRCGFTVPIHDRRGSVAALTFATDEHCPPFLRAAERHERVLQLIAVCFHIHARRKLGQDRTVDGVQLSPREFECLQWAACGKSARDIGEILGISQRTAAFHLDNAKEKLGVRTRFQAIARLAASQPRTH